MKKEDVLLRSKNENRRGDELQRSNKLKSEGYGYFTVSIILVALTILSYFEVISGNVNFFGKTIQFRDFCEIMFITSMLVEYTCKYYFLRIKRYLCFSLFWTCGFVTEILRIFF